MPDASNTDAPKVIVCGTDWCGDTTFTRRQLDDLGVPYAYVDIEQDPKAEQWVKDHNDGKLKRPTVDVDGIVLTEPDGPTMLKALQDKGLITPTR